MGEDGAGAETIMAGGEDRNWNMDTFRFDRCMDALGANADRNTAALVCSVMADQKMETQNMNQSPGWEMGASAGAVVVVAMGAFELVKMFIRRNGYSRQQPVECRYEHQALQETLRRIAEGNDKLQANIDRLVAAVNAGYEEARLRHQDIMHQLQQQVKK